MNLICISNTTTVEFHSKGVALAGEHEPVTFDWLEVGKIYEMENMVGKVFIDVESSELIDAVILKNFRADGGPSKQAWLPANLFMKVEDWREQQINKII
jgi:hypothetical protein